MQVFLSLRQLKELHGIVFTKNLQKQPPEIFGKKGVLKNFANFPIKYPCWSLFLIKLQVFRPATVLKKRLQHWCV